MKVKELKELLEKYDDDMRIITISSNYELRNNKVDAEIREIKCSLNRKTFRDDFDGTIYDKEVYDYDDNGKKALYITG